MRRVGFVLPLAILVIAGAAHADVSRALVPANAVWHTQRVIAPRLTTQIGALAASGLDVVAGRVTTPIAVLGEATIPARWPDELERDDGRSLAPTPPADRRVAALFAVTTFDLATSDQGYAMLELRARFEDGIAIWLNGHEIVREALPRGGATTLAVRPHGPEWQTFSIPVGPGTLRLGDNRLAVEVRPSGRRSAPTLAIELVARRTLGIVRGPILAEVGATTARITVETDPGLAIALEWSAVGVAGVHRLDSPAGHRHHFALANLPPRAAIEYRVLARGAPSPSRRFHTQPAAGDVVRIGVYGDVRGGHVVHRKLVEQMLTEGLDLVAVTGDMVLRGSDAADWQRFFAVAGDLLAQVPYYPVVGNHDLGWHGDPVFALPAAPAARPAHTYWYAYDLADVHLVFLDSNAYERSEQETWLAADLAAARARKVRAIIVFTHDGPYTRGTHGGNPVARARYIPILNQHRVDLVFSGHDHIYQRGEIGGARYIVSGGGGAPLYAIRCGVAGKPACKVDDGMRAVFREHHFITLALDRHAIEMCPRRIDGTRLERCVRYPLRS